MKAEDQLPNGCAVWRGEAGQGYVVVYGTSTWTDYEDTEPEDRNGWPFSGKALDKMPVERVIWDDATQTVVVIVDDGRWAVELMKFHARRYELDKAIDNFADSVRQVRAARKANNQEDGA